jgi:hypothetical protein
MTDHQAHQAEAWQDGVMGPPEPRHERTDIMGGPHPYRVDTDVMTAHPEHPRTPVTRRHDQPQHR